MDMEFPLEGDAVKTIIELAYNELIIMMKQLNEDKLSNASDDDQVAGMIHQPRG